MTRPRVTRAHPTRLHAGWICTYEDSEMPGMLRVAWRSSWGEALRTGNRIARRQARPTN